MQKFVKTIKESFSNVEKMINECAEAGATIVKLNIFFSKNLTYRPIFENGYKKKILSTLLKDLILMKKRLRKLDLKKKIMKSLFEFVKKPQLNR